MTFVYLIKEILERYKFSVKADRIGPDMLFTHWRLHFPSLMYKLCKSKFKSFHSSSYFRPGAYAISTSKIEIGENVVIRPGTMLFADTRPNGAGIIIENNVLIGSGVHIYVGNHRFDNPDVSICFQGHEDSSGVILREGCWIGANAIILPGVEIGKNAVVGAGSIVTKSIAEKVVAAGNPARIIKKIE